MGERVAEPRSAGLERRDILRANPLFSGLPADIIDRLCAYAKTKNVKRGTTIFTKGDPGQSLFAVCRGTIKISVPSDDGKDAVFNFINAGEVFGEIAVLDGRLRTADAIAAEDSQLLVIDRRDLLPLIQSSPDLATNIIGVLCARLRHTSAQVEDIVFLDLPRRLARTLLRLTRGHSGEGATYKIAVTQKEIGQIIGISRESINKQLRQWERLKWVRLERGGIMVLDRNALMAFTSEDEDD